MNISRHDWDRRSIRKQDKLQDLDKEIAETKKEHADKLNENKELLQTYEKTKYEMKNAGKATARSHKQWESLGIEVNSLQQKITYEKKEMDKNQQNIIKYEKDLYKANTTASRYEQEVPAMEEELKLLEIKKQELDDQFYTLHGEVSAKTTELQKKKDNAVSEQSKAMAIVSENKNKLKVSQNKRELGESNRKKFQDEMAEIDQHYEEYQRTLEERITSVESHQSEVNVIKEEQRSLERKAAEVQGEVE